MAAVAEGDFGLGLAAGGSQRRQEERLEAATGEVELDGIVLDGCDHTNESEAPRTEASQ